MVCSRPTYARNGIILGRSEHAMSAADFRAQSAFSVYRVLFTVLAGLELELELELAGLKLELELELEDGCCAIISLCV